MDKEFDISDESDAVSIVQVRILQIYTLLFLVSFLTVNLFQILRYECALQSFRSVPLRSWIKYLRQKPPH